jgi:sulfofructose kinase
VTGEPEFDVAGVGLNATDTLVLLPGFPPYAGKVPFDAEMVSPGGQVATAMVTCARLGLRARYIGTVGDDGQGQVQMESLREAGVNVDGVETRAGCPSQTAYILIDQSTGERTVLWRRPDCLRLEPESITTENVACARILLIDGHDTPAVEQAAKIARRHGVPVVVDVDTVYRGFERVLSSIDYLVASSEFPGHWSGERDPFRALELIQEEYKMKVAAMTLGAHGALARVEGRFIYSPAFVVDCVDTTGAGDVFHGAFCYSVLGGQSMREALDFSNAMAALNCTRLGARGGIATVSEARALMECGERRSHRDFSSSVRRA